MALQKEFIGLQIRCVRLLEYVKFTFIANKVQAYIPPLRESRKFHNHSSITLRPSQSLVPDGEYYISIDPQRINISQLQQWMASCDAHHRGTCHNLPKQDTIDVASPSILIDVQRSRVVLATDLVLATGPVQYTALSYFWGETFKSLSAKKENLTKLRIPGSLKPSQTNPGIPRTILDAMALTDIMGVSYLWVDRLCIVQDDSYFKQEELRKMASIYAESCFTIIAADGEDANHGLRGIGGQALPRVYKPTYFEFSTNVKLLYSHINESRANPPIWHTRYWTFQERAVSRRTLVFVDGIVYWQCRSSFWKEYVRATLKPVPWISLSGWPTYALKSPS
jgi:Heterokaryon incompatibility protein (HET)